MALARKCNRCGVYFDYKKCHITVESRNPEYYDVEYDLCDDCKLEFEKFMEGVKPKNLLERLLRLVE